MTIDRKQTGVPELDAMLGGGLLPGTLAVVLGATGIGKTQLGLHFAQQGACQEGERGLIFDMTARGDSQNHAAYAQALFDWELKPHMVQGRQQLDRLWERELARSDMLHLFRDSGRRVTVSDLSFDEQRAWQAELNRTLSETIRFFYGNFVHGVQRCVIDGIEPALRPSDSLQFDLFETIYHQIIRKESDWVARDLLRESFREHAGCVAQHPYDVRDITCLMLCTTAEVLLDDLLVRRIESGDVLSNANTILLMGKTRRGDRMERALQIAKHRGSWCDDRIAPFVISENGLKLNVT